jgi:hypothetical protein
MMLEVYPGGTPVQFGPHEAHILRFQGGGIDGVLYEIGFFNAGQEWIEKWVPAFLVTAKPTAEKLKIGYLQ